MCFGFHCLNTCVFAVQQLVSLASSRLNPAANGVAEFACPHALNATHSSEYLSLWNVRACLHALHSTSIALSDCFGQWSSWTWLGSTICVRCKDITLISP